MPDPKASPYKLFSERLPFCGCFDDLWKGSINQFVNSFQIMTGDWMLYRNLCHFGKAMILHHRL